MVGNRDLVNASTRLKCYHDYGTSTPQRVAAMAASDGPQGRVEKRLRKDGAP